VKLRTLVIDGEPAARELLSATLQNDREIDLVGMCSTGREAIRSIHKQEPDLIFLNTEMRELDGFEIVRIVGPDQMPYTIFLICSNPMLLRALSCHQIPYLNKPLSADSIRGVLQGAKGRITSSHESHSQGDSLSSLLRVVGQESKGPERFVVKVGGRMYLLRNEEIDWIQAEGNYVRLFARGESFLHRDTMNSLQDKLNPRMFARIHRSTIVNMDKIRELRPWPTGEYVVVMQCGKELTLSRGYRERLPMLLGEDL
jgi:two-component system, LytTR family, response regulator